MMPSPSSSSSLEGDGTGDDDDDEDGESLELLYELQSAAVFGRRYWRVQLASPISSPLTGADDLISLLEQLDVGARVTPTQASSPEPELEVVAERFLSGRLLDTASTATLFEMPAVASFAFDLQLSLERHLGRDGVITGDDDDDDDDEGTFDIERPVGTSSTPVRLGFRFKRERGTGNALHVRLDYLCFSFRRRSLAALLPDSTAYLPVAR